MGIVLVRIDDRLIHGQIVEGWLKIIDVNHIVVISDEVARDRMQQTLLSMAVPSNVKVTCCAVDEAAEKIMAGTLAGDRVLLLLSRPADVLRLVKRGVVLPGVNVGGMHFSQGKQQLLRNLSVDDEDVSALRGIAAAGIELEGRVLPSDERINVIDILRKKFGDIPA